MTGEEVRSSCNEILEISGGVRLRWGTAPGTMPLVSWPAAGVANKEARRAPAQYVQIRVGVTV